jgi:ribose/xylose/arabinose/galactoside ABC-type transport system permease subunit
LALLWIVAGIPGVFGWLAVAATLAVYSAVVAVAIGQLAVITLADPALSIGVAATQVTLIAILLIDGVTGGWGWKEGVGFLFLTGLLGGGVVFISERTSLLIASLVLLGVLGAGAVGLAQVASERQAETTLGEVSEDDDVQTGDTTTSPASTADPTGQERSQ